MKWMMTMGVAVVLSGILQGKALAQETGVQPMTLVKDGEPACSIVLSNRPSRMAMYAAAELQWHIKQITGATVPVVRERGEITGLPIYIGESTRVRELGLKNSLFAEREFAVSFFDDCIVLTGRSDDWDRLEDGPLNLDMATPPVMGGERGSLYATYEFLEEHVGVRWYAPGEANICWPSATKTLTVTPRNIRRVITIRDRSTPWTGSINAKAWGDPQPSREAVELYRLRNKATGGNIITHSFERWPERFYHKDHALFESYHPEYFSKDKGINQLCFTHTGALAQAMADARKWASGQGVPEGANVGEDFFGLEPRDTEVTCNCETCTPLMRPRSDGFNTDEASVVVWAFADKVARMLQAEFPGKSVGVLAYGNHAGCPVEMDLATNIYVGMAWGQRGPVNTDDTDYKKYRQWLDKLPGRMASVWLYPCFPRETAGTQGYIAFPEVEAHGLFERMRLFGTDKVRGFMICGQYDTVLDDWALMKAQDNPFVDEKVLTREFFTRYYGAAAMPIQTFQDMIESLGGWDEAGSWDNARGAGTDENMAVFARLIAEAVALATDEPAKSRVANIRDHLWVEMQKGKRLYTHKQKHAAEVAEFQKLPPLEAVAGRLREAPKDGDAINVDWSTFTPIKMFRNMVGFPSQDRSADFYIAHDGVNLYLRITDHVKTDRLIDTGQAWWNDRWELFVSRQSDRNAKHDEPKTWGPYRQIGVRPSANAVDLWSSVQTDMDEFWKKQTLNFHNSKKADEWTFYLTLPLATISADGPVVPGEKVYVNALAPSEVNDVITLSPTLTPGRYHNVPRLAGFLLEK